MPRIKNSRYLFKTEATKAENHNKYNNLINVMLFNLIHGFIIAAKFHEFQFTHKNFAINRRQCGTEKGKVDKYLRSQIPLEIKIQ